MGKIIDIREYFDHPGKNLKMALDKLENLIEYEICEKKELEQICENHPDMGYCTDGEFLDLCCMCEREFDYSDKIFMQKTPSLMEDLEYLHAFFHEDCLKYYFEHKNDDVDQATIDSYEFSKIKHQYPNLCMFCETEFEEGLKWTDGDDNFCDECGPMIPGVYPISDKDDKPTS